MERRATQKRQIQLVTSDKDVMGRICVEAPSDARREQDSHAYLVLTGRMTTFFNQGPGALSLLMFTITR